ncbi:MAG: class I SAM-dependent methyltransferase [Burkholderiales bacterium]|nr:class I SAM-dependent methyltransferase [Burkholderiales bacterium]
MRPVMRAARRAAAAAATIALGAAGAAAAQDEVPFITTPDRVTVAMLELAGVGERDHVLDLGSGDGRIVITAARRFGASGLGVEIVPELVRKSREHARAAGVAARVEFREQDLFTTDLSRATVVTMYLLPEVNLQLRPRLLGLAPGTRIVSHDWDMGEWAPDRSLVLDVPDKAIGREKKSRVHLWVVPAQVQGTWCAGDARLEVTQRFQRFSATLQLRGRPAPVVVFDGRVEGTVLRTEDGPTTQAQLQWRAAAAGATLQWLKVSGAASEQAGRSFVRAAAAAC